MRPLRLRRRLPPRHALRVVGADGIEQLAFRYQTHFVHQLADRMHVRFEWMRVANPSAIVSHVSVTITRPCSMIARKPVPAPPAHPQCEPLDDAASLQRQRRGSVRYRPSAQKSHWAAALRPVFRWRLSRRPRGPGNRSNHPGNNARAPAQNPRRFDSCQLIRAPRSTTFAPSPRMRARFTGLGFFGRKIVAARFAMRAA